MRVVRGVVNGVLMVTLIKPMVRLMVGRWRKRMQESPAATIGIPMQELLEAALIEELAVSSAELEPAGIEVTEVAEGRSVVRLLLVAGVVIAVTTATAYGVAELIKRRRETQAQERDLVAVPIEADALEAVDDVAQEALA